MWESKRLPRPWYLLLGVSIVASAAACHPEAGGPGQDSKVSMASPVTGAADYLRKYQGGEDGEYPLFIIDEVCSRNEGPCLEVLGPGNQIQIITEGLTADELTSLLQSLESAAGTAPAAPPEQGLALAPDLGKRYVACLPLQKMISSFKAAGAGLKCHFANYGRAVAESARRDARRPQWLDDHDIRVDVGGATRVKTYLRLREEARLRGRSD